MKLIFGVEIKKSNFEKSGIITSIVVLITAYLILIPFNFFMIIDELNELSTQPWFLGIITKFSFVLIFVKIMLLSLFTKRNNLMDRFVAAFVTQLIGFIGTTILNYIFNSFIKTSAHIDSDLKMIYSLLPFLISLVVFFSIRYIYEKNNFNLQEYLGSKK